jgi:uncharacterized protein YjbI with pentapeptide repeats
LADEEQLAILRQGVAAWNAWRDSDSGRQVDLGYADLSGANLRGAKLSWTSLYHADLRGANLAGADLVRADLTMADATDATLSDADFRGALFTSPNAHTALLCSANLTSADLRGADLSKVDLTGVKLARANLRGASLSGSILEAADLSGADLTNANLMGTLLVNTDLRGATIKDCAVYAISTWDAHLEGAVQTNLRIAPPNQRELIADDLEVAQFLYLMLHNEKIRQVIDTLTSKVVLILGRFTPERKAVLDALRDALRRHTPANVPVLFDFEGPAERNFTETVTLLARMARFIIADLTDPGSVPYELAKIVPDVHVPVQPLLLEGASTFAMAGDLWLAREMLPVYQYTTPEELLAALPERVIAPAEAKVAEIQRERATSLLRSGLT